MSLRRTRKRSLLGSASTLVFPACLYLARSERIESTAGLGMEGIVWMLGVLAMNCAERTCEGKRLPSRCDVDASERKTSPFSLFSGNSSSLTTRRHKPSILFNRNTSHCALFWRSEKEVVGK